ncbi:transposase domain-containing protein [Streptomyces sp. NPDC055966]|uniref:transposase domain-containing protein n=1 Tax=Streptomyces sp. NPDC055966 TaxID=3345669 RepID=UPI0035D97FC6
MARRSSWYGPAAAAGSSLGVGVRFLLAMCLFPEVGYRRVWDKMTWAFPGLRHAPSTKGLRDLSRRVGCAPATSLFAERA